LLCDSKTYACIRLRAHTKNNSDLCDAHAQSDCEAKDDREPEQPSEEDVGKLNAIILDMCKVLERKGHVVKMDNCYTNPTTAVEL